MIFAKSSKSRRMGTTLVETALVMLPLLMLIFGIFEYGRLLMDWNLLDNAAREGCRFALANNVDSTINTEVQNVVTNYMAGRDANFSNLTVTVSGTHTGVSTPVNNLSPGDPITVTVSGNYQLLNIIPLVSSVTVLPLSSAVTMICEGGT